MSAAKTAKRVLDLDSNNKKTYKKTLIKSKQNVK
jgi:hypothetical protein